MKCDVVEEERVDCSKKKPAEEKIEREEKSSAKEKEKDAGPR